MFNALRFDYPELTLEQIEQSITRVREGTDKKTNVIDVIVRKDMEQALEAVNGRIKKLRH